MSKKYVLYIGRWQPFHNGHKYIIDEALDAGENVLIACRDTEISESDPYSYELRKKMIEGTYKAEVEEGRVKVMLISDIEAISVGRNVGYEVRDLDVQIPEDVRGISATGIRNAMDANDPSWTECVPQGTVEALESLRGVCVWFTGLSGSGKTTIAKALCTYIDKKKLLDGDEIRKCINWDLGFSKEDRDTNIERIAYVAKCVVDAGGVAVVSAISPYEEVREYAKNLIGPKHFKMVYVNTSLEVCEERDVKGLYAKARTGEIKEFTGISDPYEPPTSDYLAIDTDTMTVDEAVDKILKYIK